MERPKKSDGELIDICWDEYPDFLYIYGHISEIELLAREIIEKTGTDFISCAGDIALIEFKYGRWAVDARVFCDHSLWEYEHPDRGRFKITKVHTKKT